MQGAQVWMDRLDSGYTLFGRGNFSNDIILKIFLNVLTCLLSNHHSTPKTLPPKYMHYSFSLSCCPVYGFIKILSPAVALAGHGTAPPQTVLFVYKVTQPSLQSVGA